MAVKLDDEPRVANLLNEILRLATRDALELGDQLNRVHVGRSFEHFQARCAAWRSRNPEREGEEFTEADFTRVRHLLTLIGFGW